MHVSSYPIINDHLTDLIILSIFSSNSDGMTEGGEDVRTNLYSHPNMVAFGTYCTVTSSSGRCAEVNAFTPDINALHRVTIIGAVVAYDCLYTLKTYILVERNLLHVPSTEMSLIPPFILRESRLELQGVLKIHVKDPTEENHSIYFSAVDFIISLALHGIFSYFVTRSPTNSDIADSECDVVFFTHDSPAWDPHNDADAENEEYAENEES